jgi:hypothetical protein
LFTKQQRLYKKRKDVLRFLVYYKFIYLSEYKKNNFENFENKNNKKIFERHSFIYLYLFTSRLSNPIPSPNILEGKGQRFSVTSFKNTDKSII